MEVGGVRSALALRKGEIWGIRHFLFSAIEEAVLAEYRCCCDVWFGECYFVTMERLTVVIGDAFVYPSYSTDIGIIYRRQVSKKE